MSVDEDQARAIIGNEPPQGGVSMVGRKQLKRGDLRVEYLTKDGDLVIHFFWERPHPTHGGSLRHGGDGFPDQPVFAEWPTVFRDVTWNALIKLFRMEDKPDRVSIAWHPEVYSFDATVKSVAIITAPSDKLMEELVYEITELIS